MRAFVSLGLAASLLACAVPAMAQSEFRPNGNGGGHAVGGGGYAAHGNGGAPAGGFRQAPGGGGFHPNRGGFHPGGAGGGRQYGGDYRRHGGYGGAAVGTGIAGLAAGALIGGAIANQNGGYGYGDDYGYGYPPPPPTYYDEDAENVEPVPAGGNAVAYCENRYKSYDPASGTFLGYDGERHPCP